jgi:transcriptional regulator with XRE-family HTH domain
MDAMALLCNMHADGPATIKLLRRAGLLSLSDISRAPHERIADLLGVSPAYARRFAREARLLGERMGDGALDPEENAPPEVRADSATLELAFDVAPKLALDAPPRHADADASAPIELRSSFAPPLADRVERAHAESAHVGHGWHVGHDERAPSAGPARARVVPMSGTRLAPGIVDGLDAGWCDRLVAQGVLTLETLVDAPLMKLARRLGVPLTALMDLQMLAQRHVAERRTDRATAGDAAELDAEPEYVIPSPHRGRDDEPFDELGLREEVALEGDDPSLAAAARSARSDASEDVGGPFA